MRSLGWPISTICNGLRSLVSGWSAGAAAPAPRAAGSAPPVDDEHAAFPGGVAGPAERHSARRCAASGSRPGRRRMPYSGRQLRRPCPGCRPAGLLWRCGTLADRLQQLADRQPGLKMVGHAAAGGIAPENSGRWWFCRCRCRQISSTKPPPAPPELLALCRARTRRYSRCASALTVALTHEQKTRIGRNGRTGSCDKPRLCEYINSEHTVNLFFGLPLLLSIKCCLSRLI